MRDISPGRDIINSPITEINYITQNEIMQATAEGLAEAENLSRTIVRHQQSSRLKKAGVLFVVAVILLIVAATIVYFVLHQRGGLSGFDVAHDLSIAVIAALISAAVSLALSLIVGALASRQIMRPTQVELLNRQRLETAEHRWQELMALGLPKSEMKGLRRNARTM